MVVQITTSLTFTLKEGKAFLQTPHQTMMLKPSRHELAGYYLLFINRILDGEYKTLQDVIDQCNTKVELIPVEKGSYAVYLDSNTSVL